MEDIHEEIKDMEENDSHAKIEGSKGGIITLPFIFANEICEKLAGVGFNANMVNYLTRELHMPITKAANTLNNFDGTAGLTPLLGAFIADAYIGRFWTITVSSIVYLIGMMSLTLSATLPQLRPPPCQANQVCQEADSKQLGILYLSLLLSALGGGGIRPCVAAFGADQFNGEDPKQTTKTWVFFNWYYFIMGVSILVALVVLVYIQDNVGWGWGLGIPTIAMTVSITIFVAGYPLYRILEAGGSPFTRLLQVIVAAVRKRKVHMVTDQKLLYKNEELDANISTDGMLCHTKQLKFFDKAAIVTENDFKSPQKPNLWRINTVHRVEELKCLIRMIPIWAAGILSSTASSQQFTFAVEQANNMDRHLTKSFQISSATISVFTTISMLVTIVLYDRLLVPLARKFTGLDRGINFLHRMAIGFFIAILATLVAGFIEAKRKHVALANGHSISVFWLVPQYSLYGIGEAFMSVGHLEFLYDQAPESMRSTATALFWTSYSVGSYASSLLVSLVHKYSAGPNGSNWLPEDDLNKAKLEYFYWLITCLQVLNLAYYLCCIKVYTFKPLHLQIRRKEDRDSKEEGFELTSQV